MKKVLVLIALFAAASVAEAQNVVPVVVAPAQPPAPARPPAAPAPARPPAAPAPAVPVAAPAAPVPPPVALRNAVNIRFDVTITDTGGAKPVTKTLSLTIGSGNNSGSVRNSAQVPNNGSLPPNASSASTMAIPLNVDVRGVNLVENGIRASVSVEYQPYVPEAKTQPGAIQANATTIFSDGRRTQILVTADPVSDRKTTIEVTATILK